MSGLVKRPNGGLASWAQLGLTILLAAFAALWVLFSSSNFEQFKRIKEDVDEIKREYVRKDALNERFKAIEIQIADLKTEAQKIVPYSTHTQLWENQRQLVVNVQRQIDELRTSVGSNYTLGDKLKDLQKQLDDLRSLLHPAVK